MSILIETSDSNKLEKYANKTTPVLIRMEDAIVCLLAVQINAPKWTILDARHLVNQALQTYLNEPELMRIQRLIAPGQVTSIAARYPDRKSEFNWIAQNRAKYRGKWVTLMGERVVAMADDAEALMQALKHQDLSESPLVHHLR